MVHSSTISICVPVEYSMEQHIDMSLVRICVFTVIKLFVEDLPRSGKLYCQHRHGCHFLLSKRFYCTIFEIGSSGYSFKFIHVVHFVYVKMFLMLIIRSVLNCQISFAKFPSLQEGAYEVMLFQRPHTISSYATGSTVRRTTSSGCTSQR